MKTYTPPGRNDKNQLILADRAGKIKICPAGGTENEIFVIAVKFLQKNDKNAQKIWANQKINWENKPKAAVFFDGGILDGHFWKKYNKLETVCV